MQNKIRWLLQTSFWQTLPLFVVLLAITPGITDYSLFFLDFKAQTPSGGLIAGATAMGILLAPFLLLEALKKGNYALAIALSSLALFLVFLVLNVLAPSIVADFPEEKMLSLGSKLAFLYFIWRGTTISWYFAVYVLLLVLELSLMQTTLFVGMTYLFRLFFLVISQNWPILQPLGLSRFLKISGRSLLLWSPMLLIIVPSFLFTKYLEECAIEGIYENSFLNHYTDPQNFEHDLTKSLDSLTASVQDNAHNRIDILSQRSENAAAEIPKELKGMIMSSIVPPKITVNTKCKWYQAGCRIGRKAAKVAAKATSAAFSSTVEKLALEVERTSSTILSDTNQGIQERAQTTKDKVTATLLELRKQAKTTFLSLYRLLVWLLLIADIGFFFVVVKSFCYVFARVLFSEEQEVFVSLEAAGKRMKKGVLRKTGNKYTIPATTRKGFLASRKYEPAGRAPKIILPQIGNSWLARLRHGTWAMNHIQMEQGRPAVRFNAPGGKEFVEWDIEAGEVVLFSHRNFVAMTETVQLSTIVSLRMSTLLLGKVFFTAATGPGKLILSSKGNPITSSTRTASGSIPESRLLAWQQHTRFSIESELNIFDVLFSGVYLKKKGSDLVVIDSDQIGAAKSGIRQFLKHFLLPI